MTGVEDEVNQLMTDAIDKNMIAQDEYPRTAEIAFPLRPHVFELLRAH